ncbi:TFIID-18kDa-domain-containing protein [Trichocladium antarcticum]|uniref:TFIID-18kDa-domain-containing protein n=1 Tax=Trichocladium antarcticum TaxID=1450529 RepID=A0AAN6UJX5_9PEZI|nr:TFIID-18kDa-domain-containing protein [Trichocladium antarcticum]
MCSAPEGLGIAGAQSDCWARAQSKADVCSAAQPYWPLVLARVGAGPFRPRGHDNKHWPKGEGCQSRIDMTRLARHPRGWQGIPEASGSSVVWPPGLLPFWLSMGTIPSFVQSDQTGLHTSRYTSPPWHSPLQNNLSLSASKSRAETSSPWTFSSHSTLPSSALLLAHASAGRHCALERRSCGPFRSRRAYRSMTATTTCLCMTPQLKNRTCRMSRMSRKSRTRTVARRKSKGQRSRCRRRRPARRGKPQLQSRLLWWCCQPRVTSWRASVHVVPGLSPLQFPLLAMQLPSRVDHLESRKPRRLPTIILIAAAHKSLHKSGKSHLRPTVNFVAAANESRRESLHPSSPRQKSKARRLPRKAALARRQKTQPHLRNMPSLGAMQPDAAAMFQDAFDEVVGIGGSGRSDKRRRMLRPALNRKGIPRQLLHPSYQLAHGTALPPIGGQVDSNGNDYNEPRPRDIIADYCHQMMYVSGETGEPSVETTGIIEDIVRQQVIEILRSCTELAARRGSRAMTINDLIFLIRDDAPKVSRLRTFLSWKDVRKNVKDSEDKGGEADLGAGEDPVGGGVVPGGPVDDQTKKNKKAKVGLPWEPSSFFAVEVPERDDEEDEEEEEMNHITLQRLRKADERTKAMTKEEYVTWSEFRQASFTYRKGKRFREWAGFAVVTDSKPSDDIVDILGFLTFEMVQTLTEEALRIKDSEDQYRERTGENAGKKRKLPGGGGLFDPPSEGRAPIEPRHVQEAFRRLQQRPKKFRAMLNGTRIQQRTSLKLF